MNEKINTFSTLLLFHAQWGVFEGLAQVTWQEASPVKQRTSPQPTYDPQQNISGPSRSPRQSSGQVSQFSPAKEDMLGLKNDNQQYHFKTMCRCSHPAMLGISHHHKSHPGNSPGYRSGYLHPL